MGEDKKNSNNKNSLVVSIVAILAIGILLVWFFYFLPTSFNLADNKANPRDVFSLQNLKSLGGQFKRAFDFTKNDIQQQFSGLSNLNLDVNVNLPRLTNEQVAELKKKVEEFAQNSNQNVNQLPVDENFNNANLNIINQ